MQSTGALVPTTPCKGSYSVCKSGFIGKRAKCKVSRSHNAQKWSITPSPKRLRRISQSRESRESVQRRQSARVSGDDGDGGCGALIRSSSSRRSTRKSSLRRKVRSTAKKEVRERDRERESPPASFINLGLVGVGSFCEVFKVRHRESQQLFAIKRSTKKLNTEEAVNCELNEVEIMKTLQSQGAPELKDADADGNGDGNGDERKDAEEGTHHAHIARFHDFWISYERRLHQIYELYPHGTLLDLVEHQTARLGLRQVLHTLEQLCRGLAFVHSVDIVHLDLKPSNVFVSNCAHGANEATEGIEIELKLKLGDFGISIDLRKAKAKTQTKGLAYSGDPIYIAPELMNFERTLSDDVCARTDIFSLGILLLELLCDIKAPSQGPIFQALRSNDIDFDIFDADADGDSDEDEDDDEDSVECAGAECAESAALRCELQQLCKTMLRRNSSERPTAAQLLRRIERIKVGHAEVLQRMAAFSCLELPPPNVSPLPMAMDTHTQTLSVSRLNRSGSVASLSGKANENEVFVQESPKTYAALFTYPSPPPSSPFSAVAVSPFANECQLDLNMAFENARSPFVGSEVEADADAEEVELSPFCKLMKVADEDARHSGFLPFGDFGEHETDDSECKTEDEDSSDAVDDDDDDDAAIPRRLMFGFL